MDNDMSTAKVGDKVWSILRGWGTVICKQDPIVHGLYRSIIVRFEGNNIVDTYDNTGRFIQSVLPDLYWDEIRFDAPPKPKKRLTKERWVAGRITDHGSAVIVRTVNDDLQRLKMFGSEVEALRDVFNTYYVDDQLIAFSTKVEVVDPSP